MMKDDIYDKLRKEIIANCPLLFKMADRPMTETCMCWGLEVDNGWLQTLRTYAYAMEGLNTLFYKLFRVRVQSDQVKSKFGTLRWYTSIVHDPGKLVCAYESLVEKLIDKLGPLGPFDYKFKKVVEVPEHDKVETKELTAEEAEEEKKRLKGCSNVKFIEHNGVWTKITSIHVYAKHKHIATKHKLLHWIYSRRWQIKGFLRRLLDWKPSEEQMSAGELLDMLQSKLIKEAEEACYNVCEHCGRPIGSDYSPRCCTSGWIAYICDECADKSENEYYKNGALWKKGECLKTKEEVDRERAEIEANFLKK